MGKRPSLKKRGMPPRIPDTPENIALACMQGPPRKWWDYLQMEQHDQDSQEVMGDEKSRKGG